MSEGTVFMSLPGERWCLEIGGDRKILDCLIKVYGATDPWIFAEGEKYYITSTAMQQPMRWDRVLEIAEEHLKLIEGAFELVFGTKMVLQHFRLVPPIGTLLEPIRAVVRCDTLRRVVDGEWFETHACPIMRKLIDNGPMAPIINEGCFGIMLIINVTITRFIRFTKLYVRIAVEKPE